jgi:hypothetical protein
MAYASIQDIAASWDHYQQFLAGLTEPAPAGLILYLAGPTDEGVRVIAVWDSEQASERFRQDRLVPAVAVISRPVPPVWTVRDLHLAHVVLGTVQPVPELKEQPSC